MKRIPIVLIAAAAFLIPLAGCQKNAVLPATGNVPVPNHQTNLSDFFPAWIQASAPATYGRRWAIGFSIGSKGYIGAGEASFDFRSFFTLQDFWEYDPSTNTWMQKANMPYSIQGGTSFVVGTQGYVCNGYHEGNDGSYFINNLIQYDQASNTWNFKSDFPGAHRASAVGTTIGNLGYVGSGSGTFYILSDWWQYDPAKDHWTELANIPGGSRCNAVAFSINSIGYVCTGYSLGSNTAGHDLWAYLPGWDLWVRKADLPAEDRFAATGFNWGQYGVVTCGAGAHTGDLNDFWYYNQSSNQWARGLDMAGGARSGAVGFSINGTPYVGTGHGPGNYKDGGPNGYYFTGFYNDLWFLGSRYIHF